jgi:hypothetical protein
MPPLSNKWIRKSAIVLTEEGMVIFSSDTLSASRKEAKNFSSSFMG